jgi:hypothetical protein
MYIGTILGFFGEWLLLTGKYSILSIPLPDKEIKTPVMVKNV